MSLRPSRRGGRSKSRCSAQLGRTGAGREGVPAGGEAKMCVNGGADRRADEGSNVPVIGAVKSAYFCIVLHGFARNGVWEV